MSFDAHNADPNLSALESALAGLRPHPSRINRDRLMFEAGRESEQGRTRRARRLWLFSTGLASVAAASFGILLLDTRSQLAQLQVAFHEPPVAKAVASASDDERSLPERPEARSETPPVLPQPILGHSASESAGAVQTPGVEHENYLAFRNRALRLGIDAVADAAGGPAARHAARAHDAPATNHELRQRYLNRSVRQPAEFESFRRSLLVSDGESS